MSDFKTDKIKIISVGSAGGNMINHMIKEGFDKAQIIAIDSDSGALENSLAKTKIKLSTKDSYHEILKQKDILKEVSILFIVAGLGGETSSNLAPLLAKIAKENKILTIGVVTTPFKFEGKKRVELAKTKLAELKKECNSLLEIPNEKLLSLANKGMEVKNTFKMANDIVMKFIDGISSIFISSENRDDLKIAFYDFRKILSYENFSFIGVGVSEGKDALKKAIQNAIKSPLISDMGIKDAMGILIHFKAHPNCSLMAVNIALSIVVDGVSDDADIIYEITSDENMKNGVEVIIIANKSTQNIPEIKDNK